MYYEIYSRCPHSGELSHIGNYHGAGATERAYADLRASRPGLDLVVREDAEGDTIRDVTEYFADGYDAAADLRQIAKYCTE